MSTYQVPVMYDGKKIIPAPLVSIQRDIQRSPDGTSRQKGWIITLTGNIVAFSGSPRNDGTFWTGSGYPPDESANSNTPELRIRNLRNKLKALSDLFATDGKWFEIQPGDGSAPIKAQIRASRITYSEGPWFNTIPFSIEMETAKIYFGSVASDYNFGTTQADNMPEENWQLEPSDDVNRVFKLTHNISASGKKLYNPDGTILAEGWQVARAYILGPNDPNFSSIAGANAVNLLGIDSQFLTSSGILNLTSHQAYNYTRTNQVDIPNGRYSVSESWVCYNPDEVSPTNKQGSGRAIEELTVENRYSADNGLYTVTVNGTITGLEEKNNNTYAIIRTRVENAELRANAVVIPSVLLNIAQTTTGLTLNPNPVSTTIAKNKINGVYQYSITFDTRPAMSPGILSEIYNVTLDNSADVFAEIGVIGRPLGPIYQNIGSTTRKAISMAAEIVVPVAYNSPLPVKPNYNPLPDVLSFIGTPLQIFVASDQENWTPRLGRYSRRTTYVYQ